MNRALAPQTVEVEGQLRSATSIDLKELERSLPVWAVSVPSPQSVAVQHLWAGVKAPIVASANALLLVSAVS